MLQMFGMRMVWRKLGIAVLALAALAACEPRHEPQMQSERETWNGEDWRVEIELPFEVLPVELHIARNGEEAWFSNGVERVSVGEIDIDGDHYRLRFPAFNNTLDLTRKGDRLEGTLTLVKRGYEQHLPVRAEPHPGYRFSADPKPEVDLTGRWEVLFTDDDGNEIEAVGEFDQQGSQLAGTFLTPTGDYRYLAGEVDGRNLRLSTFDGAHAFVFTAELDEFGLLSGDYWSGERWHESWTARRNFDARLPDAYSLTQMKRGVERFDFSFPDLSGNRVSLSDAEFRGKVVLVTLAGTWCPNCADEAEFLTEYYGENRDRGLEVVSLLFEHVEEFEQAAALGRELVEKHGIEFKVLVAGYSDKAVASEIMPMLEKVVAYPTIIFIDRAGEVRKIHTGFTGPGTGGHYLEFVREFRELMDELLGEDPPEKA